MIVFVADSEAEKRMWLAEVGRTITSLIDPYLKKKRTDTPPIYPSTQPPSPHSTLAKLHLGNVVSTCYVPSALRSSDPRSWSVYEVSLWLEMVRLGTAVAS
jgi:hypothetical protein